jgi:hypothetical protein
MSDGFGTEGPDRRLGKTSPLLNGAAEKRQSGICQSGI